MVSPERKLLIGKTAIITGGGYGIGKAIAEEFLLEGAKVGIFDINPQKVKETVKELSPLGQIIGFAVDIRNRKQIEHAFRQVEQEIGQVNTVVNNAGIDLSYPLTEFPDDVWNRILDTNLTGSQMMTQIAVKRMIKLGIKGSITFITSVHTAQAFPGGAAYDASKHAMVGLMRVAALEFGKHGIRCNAIAPGAIYPTGITEKMTQEEIGDFSKRIPLQRVGTPNDIAQAAVFISSDMASFMNGAEIRIDGGLAIKTPLFD